MIGISLFACGNFLMSGADVNTTFWTFAVYIIVARFGMAMIMAVFVASFAGTTLDTATRIQRYVLSELFTSLKLDFLTGKYMATAIAVGTALILAFATGASGNGALKLWPLFGAVNQTLAALALIVITVYLKARGGFKWLVAGIPAVFMAVMTLWAAVLNQFQFGSAHNLLLQTINVIIIVIAAWIVVEGVVKFFQTDDTSDQDAQVVTVA
jgi:carbon starvation protein